LLVAKNTDKDGETEQNVRKGWRSLGAAAFTALQSKKVGDVQVLVTKKAGEDSDALGVFMNSLSLSNYHYTLKEESDEKDTEEEKDADPRLKKSSKTIGEIKYKLEVDGSLDSNAVKFQKACAEGTLLARRLCSTRGTVADPAYMEEQVRKVIDGNKKCTIEVVDHNKLQEQGMMLFYNVGKGADAHAQPRCVIVHYKGNPDSKEVETAFIGKGVTYDTGGLNLKPTGSMELMYGDKGGSCAVIGALKGTLELDLKKNIVFACGFAENAIGSGAYKPSDIIKSMKGLYVSIGNTDAEGRLVLADTFTYVQKNYSPK